MMVAVPALDIADDTFVRRPPAVVAAAVADRSAWRCWWPDLDLRLTRDRGAEGLQWDVGGPLAGTMELWLEQVGSGTVVHYYLRADPVEACSPRRLARQRRRRVLAWKRAAFALKDELEGADTVR